VLRGSVTLALPQSSFKRRISAAQPHHFGGVDLARTPAGEEVSVGHQFGTRSTRNPLAVCADAASAARCHVSDCLFH